MKLVTVSIAQVLAGGICVSSTDGHKIHQVIYDHIKAGDKVQLSFRNVTRMTTAFLNSAVGQLYGEFSEEQIRQHLAPPIDAEPWHLNRLKLVVDRAKRFFADGGRSEAFLRITGLDDE